MTSRRTISLLCSLLGATIAVSACGGTGSSDVGDDGPGDAAGAGGANAGAGGQAGKAGAASAGKAGASGQSGGSSGAAGKAGASAAAGASGQAGAAGQAGKAGGAAGASGVGGVAGAAGAAGACASPKQLCGGQCTDVTSDPAHCGDCATACTAGQNQVSTCAASKCGVACKAGFLDCDGKPGCEADATSTDTCGKCDNKCAAGSTCKNGACVLSCAPGTADCDGLPANGCEVDTQTDPANCGVCNKSCGGAACVMGACGCAGTTEQAKLLPLDLYVMMDRSSSMESPDASGAPKWDAVKKALNDFMADPKSGGIGVGIQYFPQNTPGVPDSCTKDSQCKGAGPCSTIKFCKNSDTGSGTIYRCNSNAECENYPGTPACLELRQCFGGLITCFAGDPGCNGGTCAPLGRSCEQQSCSVPLYAAPAVAIASLPGNAAAMSASLAATSPVGLTPTKPAVEGALQYAKQYASTNPTHTVVVVLVTDGIPTQCDGSIASIAQLTAAGASGSPAIKSYVVGVFSQDELAAGAKSNLDQLAAAGGGQPTAFIADTGANVSQQFLDAMNKIRTATLSCDYAMPVPSGGGTLDISKVNVVFTDGGASTTIPQVASPAACDPVKGGWYYDDPATPTKIQVCASTCASFQGAAGGKVEVQLGCSTIKL